MCAKVSQNEYRVLLFSALLASMFAIGGLILGWLVGSLVIIFDGVYSSVSLLLTLLSLAVSRYIQTPSNHLFPFGKAILEPVVITIKASVILLVVAYSLYSAVIALFNGGREIDTSIATLFGLVNVIGCGYAWWYIASKSKTFSSGLIEAESKQWQMDTLLSVAVTLGFAIAWVVTFTPLSDFAVYADPIMMCVMSIYFIKVPLDMLRESVRELLQMSPNQEICAQVDEGINQVLKHGHQNIRLAGLAKIGRELRVNVDIQPQNKTSISLHEIEKIRGNLTKQLSELPFELNLIMNIAR